MVFTPVSLPIFWTNSFALAQHLIDSYLSNLCPCKIDRYPLFSDHMHLKFQLLLTYHKKFSSAKYLISILEPFASWFLVYLYSSHLFPSKSFNCGQESWEVLIDEVYRKSEHHLLFSFHLFSSITRFDHCDTHLIDRIYHHHHHLQQKNVIFIDHYDTHPWTVDQNLLNTQAFGKIEGEIPQRAQHVHHLPSTLPQPLRPNILAIF